MTETPSPFSGQGLPIEPDFETLKIEKRMMALDNFVLWVGADGYPVRILVEGAQGARGGNTTIRYSRFNDPTIRIEAP